MPKGLVIAHRCDNPLCGEPSHLEAVTQRRNIQDGCARGRGPKPPQIRGETHPNAPLTDAQVRAIRRSRASQTQLAARYGVTQSCISQLQRGLSRTTADGAIRPSSRQIVVDTDGAKLTKRALARKHNIPYTALVKRLRNGWSIERAVTQPLKGQKT